MASKRGLVLAFTSAIGLASCAYLIHGNTEAIEVNSEPSGANVVVSNGETGITPFSIIVRRDTSLAFHISKEGYEPVDVYDDTEAQYPAALLAATGLPGTGAFVDVVTGADHAHKLQQLNIQLQSVGAVKASTTPTPPSNSNWPKPPSTAE